MSSFRALARSLPEAMLCVSTSGHVLEVNRAAKRMLGQSDDRFHLAEVMRDTPEAIERYLRMCCRSRSFLPGTLHLRHRRDDIGDVRSSGVRLDLEGADAPMVLLRIEDKKQATAVFAALNRELDKLTAQRRTLNLQRELIARQQQELLDYSAPMIDVWDGVLLVPLFGVINEAYIDRVLGNLLEMVVQRRARWVIVDLTATPSASPLLISGMVRIARTVGLLGASCVLTGLGPTLAHRFAAEGDTPEGLSTVRNLQTALALCLGTDAVKTYRRRSDR